MPSWWKPGDINELIYNFIKHHKYIINNNLSIIKELNKNENDYNKNSRKTELIPYKNSISLYPLKIEHLNNPLVKPNKTLNINPYSIIKTDLKPQKRILDKHEYLIIDIYDNKMKNEEIRCE